MYVYCFILAFTIMLALTFFVFFSYPKSWQKNRIVKIVLLIQHSLGSLALGIVFICYKDVPYEWMKWIVSRWATIYQVTVIMLSAFFFIRLIISKCYHLIRKNSDFEKKEIYYKQKASFCRVYCAVLCYFGYWLYQYWANSLHCI